MLEELFSILISNEELELRYDPESKSILEELFNILVSNEALEAK